MASPFQKETSKKQPAKARTIVSLSYPFAQSCPTLCNPMDCSPPGSSVHGILQAGVLEWVSIAFSRGSSQLRDWTWVSHIPGRCFNLWATREECLSRPEQFCAVTMKGGSCSLSRVWLCKLHRLWPTRLFCPWDFPGKNTRASCHFLLYGIFLTWGSNPCFLSLLLRWADSLPWSHLRSPGSIGGQAAERKSLRRITWRYRTVSCIVRDCLSSLGESPLSFSSLSVHRLSIPFLNPTLHLVAGPNHIH